MPQTNPPLPSPPEYPASNASYNKIVGKMHKVAIAAETSTAAIGALEMCKGMVGGINTYAKSCRRYADRLITALNESHPVDKPLAAAKKARVAKEKAAAEKAAPKAKPAPKATAKKVKELA